MDINFDEIENENQAQSTPQKPENKSMHKLNRKIKADLHIKMKEESMFDEDLFDEDDIPKKYKYLAFLRQSNVIKHVNYDPDDKSVKVVFAYCK
jgi:hypothetical protein